MSDGEGCPPDCSGDGCDESPIDMLKRILTGPKKEQEHIGFLSPDEVRMWNDLESERKDLNKRAATYEARKKLFWATVGLNHNAADRSLKVDIATSSLTADRE